MVRLARWAWLLALPILVTVTWAATGQMPPAKVVLGKVIKETVTPTAAYPGTIHFRHIASVAAETSGRAVKVYVEEGDRVKRNSPLARLDTELLQQELKRLQGETEESRALLEKARADLMRAKTAYEKEAISSQLYDNRRFTAKSLEGKVNSLKAAIRAVKIKIAKSTIRAPFSGVVLKRFVEVGDWVSQGSPVVKLAEFSQMEAVIPVPAGALSPALSPGTRVTLKVTAWKGKQVKGRIYSVVPEGDTSSRTYPVKVVVDNPKGLLMDGMEVTALLPIGKPKEAMLVPRDAIVQMGPREFVFTVKGGKATVITVKVTGYQETFAMVESPYLAPGMPVVVRGNERLRPNQPVIVVSKGSYAPADKGRAPKGH